MIKIVLNDLAIQSIKSKIDKRKKKQLKELKKEVENAHTVIIFPPNYQEAQQWDQSGFGYP